MLGKGQMTMLDEHSPVPLYHQLKSILEQQIDSGYFQPGEKIPSENELCKQHKISPPLSVRRFANW